MGGNGFWNSSWFIGFVLLLMLLGSKGDYTNTKEVNICQKKLPLNYKTTRIGMVFDSGSQIGRQQMVAMKMGLRDFHLGSSCVKLKLLLHHYNSHPNLTSPNSSALDLIAKRGVKAIIIGTILRKQDLIVISNHKIPILSISSITQLLKTPSLIQMTNNITHHIQCIASILTHFQLPPKVTIFYETTKIIDDHPFLHSSVSAHPLFDSFLLTGVEVEHHLSLSSATNQEILIQRELKRLMNNQKNKRVFIITHLSLELVDLLLTKARKLNMIGNGYTWIVSHENFDLISSLDSSSSSSSSSLLSKMECVIGFQTYFNDTKNSFKNFETRFKKIYKLEYPEEEEPTKASIFAIRAYDAAYAITRAMQNLRSSSSDHEVMKKILESNFEGVSGEMVRFSKMYNNNDEMLISKLESPKLIKIMKVVNQTLKEVAFWTPKLGYVEKFNKKLEGLRYNNDNIMGKIVGARKLLEMRGSKKHKKNEERRLKIAVPGEAACEELVKVSYFPNGTKNFSGLSIDVFRAVMENKSLYDFILFNGSYNEMIEAVYNKTYDGAVGDITILAERFKKVDFTVAYLKTDIVMVVTKMDEKWKRLWAFMEAFDFSVWIMIPTMHIFISLVIWLNERHNNNELNKFGTMLWFSVSVIFHVHREPVKNGSTRIVLGPWLFAIVVVIASFSASLTALMTNDWAKPSVRDVETLKQMPNCTVGCNVGSFICDYLENTLKFEPSKVIKMKTVDDYAELLKKGNLTAAFFIRPQADVFLAKNCKGFTKAVSIFHLSGIGFAFQKGSELTANVSRSIANLTEANNITAMKQNLLDSFNCSSSDKHNGLGLGPEPFLGLFTFCGSIALLVLIYWSCFLDNSDSLAMLDEKDSISLQMVKIHDDFDEQKK